MSSTAGIHRGSEGTATLEVTREVTVAHFHPDMPEVFGTPFMIYLMEVAASNAIQPHLPAGWVSVGTEVNVKHTGATPIGRTVTAKARVLTIDDRTVTFSVVAHDGIEQIGIGTHARMSIDLARFQKHLAKKQSI